MNKKIGLCALVVFFVLSVSYYVSSTKSNSASEIIIVDSETLRYTHNDVGLSFEYPAFTKISEQYFYDIENEHRLDVYISGDEYEIYVSTGGRGYPTDDETTYFELPINGQSTEVRRDIVPGGYIQNSGMCSMVIEMTLAVSSEVEMNKILESMTCVE